MSKRLVNGIGGTVLPDRDEWRWPENPTEPRDIIAAFFRSWGRDLAYGAADGLIAQLGRDGFSFCRAYQRPPERR